MANRFQSKGETRYGHEPLPTGYSSTVKPDVVIPSVGIEDVDVAVFNLFDSELPLQVGGADGADMKKVPVIFAGGEKWAQLKKNKPLRDKVNSLILPLITIGRTGVKQTVTEDIAGRAINQKTGEIQIRRRLSKTDREYQRLVNRLEEKNQPSVALNTRDDPGLLTLAPVGDLAGNISVQNGAKFLPQKNNNIIETIVVPTPQFITVTYEITIWTQYTHHMNQITETLMSSYLPQTQGWRLDTSKGYWFVAEVEEDSMTPETNFDDLTQGERLIKQKINLKVPAYIFASSAPGVPIPVKRYLSMPRISFEIGVPKNTSELKNPSPVSTHVAEDVYLGVDDPTLPLEKDRIIRPDLRRTGADILSPSDKTDPRDPALINIPRGRAKSERYARILYTDVAGKKSYSYVKMTNVNKSTGETTYLSGLDLSNLSGVEVDE